MATAHCIVLVFLALATASSLAAPETPVRKVGDRTIPYAFQEVAHKIEGPATASRKGNDIKCNEVREPTIPKVVPRWAAGRTADELAARGYEEVISEATGKPVGAFVKDHEVVMKKCLASHFEPVVHRTRPTGLDLDPRYDIYFDCDPKRKFVIKLTTTVLLGRTWVEMAGHWRLIAPHKNVILHGRGKRRILEVLPRAEVALHGLTLTGGAEVNMAPALDKTQTRDGGWNGGAVLVWFTGAFTAHECDFRRNSARAFFARWGSGGAIKCEGSSYCLIWGCAFDNNEALTGGAIATSSASVLYVRNSTFKRNKAIGGMDGGQINKGRDKNLILVKAGAIRVDSVAGHKSSKEHVVICNSDFTDNQIIFDMKRLKKVYGYNDKDDLDFVRGSGAALSLWNTPGNLMVGHTRHFLTIKGCVFERNKERIGPVGDKLGRYVVEMEGAGHMVLKDSMFKRNRVERAVCKLNNSLQWKGNQKYEVLVQNVKFYRNRRTFNLEFESGPHPSQCRIRSVSGVKDTDGDCRDLLLAAVASGGNHSEPEVADDDDGVVVDDDPVGY